MKVTINTAGAESTVRKLSEAVYALMDATPRYCDMAAKVHAVQISDPWRTKLEEAGFVILPEVPTDD